MGYKVLQKNLTFSQYKMADVTLLTTLCCVFEALITVAAIEWFPEQPYSVSLVYAFVALVSMRWNGYSVVTALCGGLTYCITANLCANKVAAAGMPFTAMGAQGYLVILGGNLFCLLVLILHKVIGKQKIRDSILFSILYVAAVFVSMSLGRFGIMLLVNTSVSRALEIVMYDLLSFVFALVIVLICRKQNGLFEDQRSYLLRLEEERRNKQAQG